MEKELKQALTLIKEKLELSDELAVENRVTQEVINSTLYDIVKADHKGEEIRPIVDKYRREVSKAYLMKEDFENLLFQLIGMYTIIKELGLEDNLEAEDKKRLQYLLEHNDSIYILKDKKLSPRDPEMYETVYDNFREDEGYVNTFIKNLRSTELYLKLKNEEEE